MRKLVKVVRNAFTPVHTVTKMAKDGILHCKPSYQAEHWARKASHLCLALIIGIPLLMGALQVRADAIQARAEQAQDNQRDQERQFAQEQNCLATTLYWEASSAPRGEGNLTDMLAIGQNVLERTVSEKFPSAICGVVNEIRTSKSTGKYVAQYSYIQDGRGAPTGRKWLKANTIAKGLLEDWYRHGRNFHYYPETRTLAAYSVNYHAEGIYPVWAKKGTDDCSLLRLGKLGAHYHYADFRAANPAAWEACRLQRFAQNRVAAR